MFASLWDELLSQGVVSVTAQELAARTRTSIDSVYVATHRAKAANKIFSPSPGLYVLVPPQYRSWGVVPADWFIDDLMHHLGHGYYVTLLSAAAMYGATHQASQVFQVMADHRVQDRDIDRLRLRFYLCSSLHLRPARRLTGPTGRLSVATPETCAFDMAERPDAAGGINTIVDVLGDLDVDANALVDASNGRARTVIRRCGWLLEHTGSDRDLAPLHDIVATDSSNPTPLVPGGKPRGEIDRTWNVVVNTLVDHKS